MSQRITKLVIRMPEELHLQLRQQASERHQSMNTVALLGIAREVQPQDDGLAQLVRKIDQLSQQINKLDAEIWRMGLGGSQP